MSWYFEGIADDAVTASAAIDANKSIPDTARVYLKEMVDQLGPQPTWAGGLYIKSTGHYHTGTLHNPGSANTELTVKWMQKMKAPVAKPTDAQAS